MAFKLPEHDGSGRPAPLPRHIQHFIDTQELSAAYVTVTRAGRADAVRNSRSEAPSQQDEGSELTKGGHCEAGKAIRCGCGNLPSKRHEDFRTGFESAWVTMLIAEQRLKVV